MADHHADAKLMTLRTRASALHEWQPIAELHPIHADTEQWHVTCINQYPFNAQADPDAETTNVIGPAHEYGEEERECHSTVRNKLGFVSARGFCGFNFIRCWKPHLIRGADGFARTRIQTPLETALCRAAPSHSLF
jgi:hypothetical protein